MYIGLFMIDPISPGEWVDLSWGDIPLSNTRSNLNASLVLEFLMKFSIHISFYIVYVSENYSNGSYLFFLTNSFFFHVGFSQQLCKQIKGGYLSSIVHQKRNIYSSVLFLSFHFVSFFILLMVTSISKINHSLHIFMVSHTMKNTNAGDEYRIEHFC